MADSSQLYGPDGNPVGNHVYPLGGEAFTSEMSPSELFDAGFKAVDPRTGRRAGNLPRMVMATWAAASTELQQIHKFMSEVEVRLSALERSCAQVFKRIGDKIGDADLVSSYGQTLEENQKSVRAELQELAQAAASQMGAQTGDAN